MSMSKEESTTGADSKWLSDEGKMRPTCEGGEMGMKDGSAEIGETWLAHGEQVSGREGLVGVRN